MKAISLIADHGRAVYSFFWSSKAPETMMLRHFVVANMVIASIVLTGFILAWGLSARLLLLVPAMGFTFALVSQMVYMAGVRFAQWSEDSKKKPLTQVKQLMKDRGTWWFRVFLGSGICWLVLVYLPIVAGKVFFAL